MTDSLANKPTRRATWKARLGRLALLASVLVMLSIALEIGARLLVSASPPIIRDGRIGARHIRSQEGEFYIAEIDQNVFLSFNDEGFRGPDRPFEKPHDTVRVAVMGDSMIASLAVAEDELMTTKLERMLSNSIPSKRWEVMNFGVSGASTAQQIALYRELVQKFDPDIVLSCFFVGNDLSDNCNRLSNNPRIYFDFDEDGNFHQLPQADLRSTMSRWLNRNSRFYVWQKRATRIARRNLRKATRQLSPSDCIYATETNKNVTHAWAVTSKAIETLNEDVTSQGRMFAVVVVPTASQIYTDCFQQLVDSAPEATEHFDIENPDRRLGEICHQLGVQCWSMTGDFRAESPSRSQSAKQEWLFLGGSGHLNEQGNTVAARSVHRFLTEQDISGAARLSSMQRVTAVR